MYLAGHLLASVALAKVAHKPLRVNFFSLAIAAMAVNLIDADHLLFYYRDTGFGNSFMLHPLHKIWAFVGLATCLLALVLKQWQGLIFGMFFALMLHFGLDALSNVVEYNLHYVLGFEILCLGALTLMFWKDEQRVKYMLFFVGTILFCNAILGLEMFVLNWQPHETRRVYSTSVILNLLCMAIFYGLFKSKKIVQISKRR